MYFSWEANQRAGAIRSRASVRIARLVACSIAAMPADSTIRRPTDRRSASRYRHRVRSNTFRYAGSRAGFGVAHLFGDRIELMSFELLGPRVRRIYLDSITHLDYHPLQDGGNLGLY